MKRRMKRMKEIDRIVGQPCTHTLEKAVSLLKACKEQAPSFDPSIELSLYLGVDPRKADQNVRGTVTLPHGTGKKLRIVVLAKGEAAEAAEAMGIADVGSKEILEKIAGGWTNFDLLITTPDMMRDLGRLGKILGPRGLMPNPKAGTVTTNIRKALEEFQAGKLEFRVDKQSTVNIALGKLSFTEDQIVENVQTFLKVLQSMRPSSTKGDYMKSMFLSFTMGPGLKVKTETQANS